MVIQVKICGITSTDAADAALRAGVEFAGLMFHPKSPRNLAPDQAHALASRLRGRTQIVAVLADASDETIAGVNTIVRPDFIQLHGAETPERVASIRARFQVKLIKVIPVADAGDFAGLAAYEESADMFLFDAKAPSGAEREGGHGAAFDWKVLSGRTIRRPWLLAGGLNPENVGRAIRSSGAPGVDVSSGVETSPGVKSASLIADFVAAARGAQFKSGAAA
jgi:phosphoribosylanthranilate isomerase